MVTLDEVVQSVLKYRVGIIKLFLNYRLRDKYFDVDDMINQFLVERGEKVCTCYDPENPWKASLDTYVAGSIRKWCHQQRRKYAKRVYLVPFTNLRGRCEGDSFLHPADPHVYGIRELLTKYERDELAYALFNLPLYYRDAALMMVECNSYREKAMKGRYTYQRQQQIEKAIIRFMVDYISTHAAPIGFARTFTIDQLCKGENQEWTPADLTFPCVCNVCGRSFRHHSKHARYCSEKCKRQAIVVWNNNKLLKKQLKLSQGK